MSNPTMNLAIFAFHVSSIMIDVGKFTLHPCENVVVNINVIDEENVYVNGHHEGNRHGARDKFVQIVSGACPTIEFWASSRMVNN